MKRYLDDEKFQRFLKDFNFLFKIVKNSQGEFDLRLRDNYFNLYYKGNSLAKVNIRKGVYKISIHKKFATDDVFAADERFYRKGKKSRDYLIFSVNPDLLHPFFQKKHLDRFCSNVKEVNYGEEIAFEQKLITDNLEREEIFIIDRQVTETSLKRKRMDLLALEQMQGNEYRFLAIEVKLGNNRELRKDVGVQLQGYVNHINSHFDDWKLCYKKNYKQIKQTRIFDKPSFESIEIINDTKGLVAVGGYSGIGKKSIEELEHSYPDINVKQFPNKL